MNPTVFIVDDDPMIRDALSLVISHENLSVSVFSNGHDFLEACPKETIGCAIVDLNMPSMSGIELQTALLNLKIALPIIFLTGYGDIPTSVKAIKAGAKNFLTKPINADELLTSIKLAILDSIEISSKNHFHSDCLSRIEGLTERELDVTKLIVKGIPNKVVAQELGISHRTVEIHRANIITKTGAMNLLHLERIAREAGVVNNIDDLVSSPSAEFLPVAPAVD
jgi:FixJ family two-component response regulator